MLNNYPVIMHIENLHFKSGEISFMLFLGNLTLVAPIIKVNKNYTFARGIIQLLCMYGKMDLYSF